jgi:hypothetical protein
VNMASGTIASARSERRFSTAVATQLATITPWTQHLLYLRRREKSKRPSVFPRRKADPPSKIPRP